MSENHPDPTTDIPAARPGLRQMALQGAALIAVLTLAWPYFGLRGEALPWPETAFAIGGVALLLATLSRQPWWWKLIHAEGGFRPMLFDLATDPDELTDLGAAHGHADEIARLMAMLNDWARRPAQRTTISHAEIAGMRGKSRRFGIIIGAVEADELAPDLRAKITGRPERDYRG